MPKNGKAAAKAVEPGGFYDSLSQDDMDIHDDIGGRGYRVTRNEDGTFEASKGMTRVGGIDSLAELLTEVKSLDGDEEFDNDVDASNEVENSADADDSPAGDGYLFPGMKPTQQQACPALATAILNYESYKRERMDALAKEVEAKTEVVGLMHRNKKALAFDPKTGIRSYRVNDYIEELVPGEEKLKSRRVSDEDED